MNVIKWIRGWFEVPRPEVGFLAISPQAQDYVRRMKIAKLHKDLDDCKKRLETAVKAKKKSSDIRKEYEGLRTQVLREEGNVG